MKTEITIKFTLNIPSFKPRLQKTITDLICEYTQTLMTQITMLSAGKVTTSITIENNDIGTVELDPMTGLDKAEQV